VHHHALSGTAGKLERLQNACVCLRLARKHGDSPRHASAVSSSAPYSFSATRRAASASWWARSLNSCPACAGSHCERHVPRATRRLRLVAPSSPGYPGGVVCSSAKGRASASWAAVRSSSDDVLAVTLQLESLSVLGARSARGGGEHFPPGVRRVRQRQRPLERDSALTESDERDAGGATVRPLPSG
jgi:hypothetical protein